jgi:hypothetical protein
MNLIESIEILKMNGIWTELDNFESLNPIEEFFARDDIDSVRELQMTFPLRFSEICAKFGSQRCFDYILEKEDIDGKETGTENSYISSKVNLYLIKENKAPLPYINHSAELWFILYYDRKEFLPLIDFPPIHIAFKTMLKFMRENSFDTSDYAQEIYDLYPSEEWCDYFSKCNGETIIFLLQTRKDYLLRNVKIKSCIVSRIATEAPTLIKKLQELCIVPTVCTNQNIKTLKAIRSHGIFARKTNTYLR